MHVHQRCVNEVKIIKKKTKQKENHFQLSTIGWHYVEKRNREKIVCFSLFTLFLSFIFFLRKMNEGLSEYSTNLKFSYKCFIDFLKQKKLREKKRQKLSKKEKATFFL